MAHDRVSRECHQGSDETPRSLREARKAHVERVLCETEYDLAEAARVLAIDETQLRKMMCELGIEPSADPGGGR